jgi:hypothetical protein
MNQLSEDHIKILRASGINERNMSRARRIAPKPTTPATKVEKVTAAQENIQTPKPKNGSAMRRASTPQGSRVAAKPSTAPAMPFSPFVLLLVVLVVLVAMASLSGR